VVGGGGGRTFDSRAAYGRCNPTLDARDLRSVWEVSIMSLVSGHMKGALAAFVCFADGVANPLTC